MSSQPKTLLTPEQYLELERKAAHKSEYFQGERFAMAGASVAHNRLVARLLRDLGGQLRGRGCEALPSDMRVFVAATGLYTYPDVVVVCGEPVLQDGNFDTLLNPAVLVEVLSPSTEAYDRGRKFEHYRTIESLREYLLLASDRIHADVYTRQGDERWLLTSAGRMEESVTLQSIDCRLALADLYGQIDLSAPV
ncbi:MAG: Uma2 family endonuclease [Acidobacteria bacterium]|nr:Uma2 family endonuclease [Acidobacteriota bacterium]